MLEELLPHKFGTVRRLRNSEKTLVRRILEQQASDNTARRTRLDSLDVQEMSDGAWGVFVFPGRVRRRERVGSDAESQKFNSTTSTVFSS